MKSLVFSHAWNRSNVHFFSLDGAELFINTCNSGVAADNRVELLTQLKLAKEAWEQGVLAAAAEGGGDAVTRQDKKRTREGALLLDTNVTASFDMARERLKFEEERFQLQRQPADVVFGYLKQIEGKIDISNNPMVQDAIGNVMKGMGDFSKSLASTNAFIAPPAAAMIVDSMLMVAPHPAPAMIGDGRSPIPAMIGDCMIPQSTVIENIDKVASAAIPEGPGAATAVEDKILTIEEVARSMGCDKDQSILNMAYKDIAAEYKAVRGDDPRKERVGTTPSGKEIIANWYVVSDEAILRSGMAKAIERRRQQKLAEAEKEANIQARKAAAELKRQAKGKGKLSANWHDGKHFTPEIAGIVLEESA